MIKGKRLVSQAREMQVWRYRGRVPGNDYLRGPHQDGFDETVWNRILARTEDREANQELPWICKFLQKVYR